MALTRALAVAASLLIVATGCASTPPTPRPSATPTSPSGSAPPTDPGATAAPTDPGATAAPTDPGASPAPTDPGASPAPTATPVPTPVPTPAGTPPPYRDARIGLEPVLDGLACEFPDPGQPCGPVGVFHAGDERLFIAMQDGIVYLAKPRGEGRRYERTGTFLDMHRRVACCGERGLLGMAFHPDFAANGLFYVAYADNTHSVVLDERRVSADPDVAADARRNLFTLYKRHEYHWGGGIHFGPDRMLWMGMGDGGYVQASDPIGDPDRDAQKLDSLFGKLLRIDPADPDGDGPARYGIPADNPYVDEPGALPEIWARGLRNPWRWSFDRLTGDIWLSDTGHNSWEEINRLKAPDLAKGANFGWRLMEGPDCYIPPTGCDRDGDLRLPTAAYRHTGGQCAITGGQVYRGEAYPALASHLLFTDYCSGRIWTLDSGGRNQQRPRLLLDSDLLISSIGADARGELYVTDYLSGTILRITGEPA